MILESTLNYIVISIECSKYKAVCTYESNTNISDNLSTSFTGTPESWDYFPLLFRSPRNRWNLVGNFVSLWCKCIPILTNSGARLAKSPMLTTFLCFRRNLRFALYGNTTSYCTRNVVLPRQSIQLFGNIISDEK